MISSAHKVLTDRRRQKTKSVKQIEFREIGFPENNFLLWNDKTFLKGKLSTWFKPTVKGGAPGSSNS